MITKFFYRSNNLCFQILLRVEDGDLVQYQEFTDYADYKRTLGELQSAKGNGTAIKIPEKSFSPGDFIVKVA